MRWMVRWTARRRCRANGSASGRPRSSAYDAFCAQVDAGEETLIDPYAAEAPEEFFAVASEYHFSAPDLLQQALPEVAAQLRRFYGEPPKIETR
jgi:Mlc titration factor MtfA (ptsG expression regulator)